MKKSVIIGIIVAVIVILVLVLGLNSINVIKGTQTTSGDDYLGDGIVLMQHESEGYFQCFGCGTLDGQPTCIDPILEMKSVEESDERYCNDDFKLVENGVVLESGNEDEEILDVSPEPENIECSREFSPKYGEEPFYEGPLFDAHFHMPNLIDVSEVEGHGNYGEETNQHTVDPVLREAMLDKILCNFDKEKLIGVIGFVMGDEVVLDETLNAAKSIEEKSSGKVKLFLTPVGFSTESLESIEESDKGLFKGYGEIAFYHPSYADTPPDSSEVMGIYEVAEKNNLIVMIHPDGRQENKVENAIRNNPGVTFLIHGPEPEDYVTSLMNKYSNVYYSLDAILIRESGFPGALMYTVGGKGEFKSKFKQNYDVLMSNAVNKWKTRIEQYPGRFMWGTDRGDLWTYDEDVSVLLEEFGRDFISKLDPAVQDKFAYKNAESILE